MSLQRHNLSETSALDSLDNGTTIQLHGPFVEAYVAIEHGDPRTLEHLCKAHMRACEVRTQPLIMSQCALSVKTGSCMCMGRTNARSVGIDGAAYQ